MSSTIYAGEETGVSEHEERSVQPNDWADSGEEEYGYGDRNKGRRNWMKVDTGWDQPMNKSWDPTLEIEEELVCGDWRGGEFSPRFVPVLFFHPST